MQTLSLFNFKDNVDLYFSAKRAKTLNNEKFSNLRSFKKVDSKRIASGGFDTTVRITNIAQDFSEANSEADSKSDTLSNAEIEESEVQQEEDQKESAEVEEGAEDGHRRRALQGYHDVRV